MADKERGTIDIGRVFFEPAVGPNLKHVTVLETRKPRWKCCPVGSAI